MSQKQTTEEEDDTEVITQLKTEMLDDENIVEGARVKIHSFDLEGTIVDAETPKVKIDNEDADTIELEWNSTHYEYQRSMVNVFVEETATVTVPEYVDFNVSDDPTSIKGVGPVTAGGCETIGQLIYYSREDEIPHQAPREIKNLIEQEWKHVETEREVIIDEDYDEEKEGEVEEDEENVDRDEETSDTRGGETVESIDSITEEDELVFKDKDATWTVTDVNIFSSEHGYATITVEAEIDGIARHRRIVYDDGEYRVETTNYSNISTSDTLAGLEIEFVAEGDEDEIELDCNTDEMSIEELEERRDECEDAADRAAEIGADDEASEYAARVDVLDDIIEERKAERKERVEGLAEEIEANSMFSPQQSLVVACKKLGLGHGETAEVLDKSADTVRKTWHDCRKQFEQALWAVDELEDTFD